MTKGERIKQLREKAGLNQVVLADKINVSKQTMYKYENDIISNIPSDKIEALAKVFKCTPAYLMGWIPETPEGLLDYYDTAVEEAVSVLKNDGFIVKFDNYSFEPFLIIESSNHETLLAIYEGDFLSHYEQLKLKNEQVKSIDLIKNISPSLSPDETTLLTDYRKLNDTGQSKVREYANDLTEQGKYRKDTGLPEDMIS